MIDANATQQALANSPQTGSVDRGIGALLRSVGGMDIEKIADGLIGDRFKALDERLFMNKLRPPATDLNRLVSGGFASGVAGEQFSVADRNMKEQTDVLKQMDEKLSGLGFQVVSTTSTSTRLVRTPALHFLRGRRVTCSMVSRVLTRQPHTEHSGSRFIPGAGLWTYKTISRTRGTPDRTGPAVRWLAGQSLASLLSASQTAFPILLLHRPNRVTYPWSACGRVKTSTGAEPIPILSPSGGRRETRYCSGAIHRCGTRVLSLEI